MASTANSSPATCQATFEQGVAISLHLWEALALAVQNNWGGPDSADKRDWFAGAVVELFPDVSRLTPAQLQQKTSTQQQQQQQQTQGSTQHHHQSTSAQNGSGSAEEPDQADVEALLLQVMLDEFEVNVDDESAFEVAEQVVRLRGECLRGKFDGVEALRRRWEGRKGNKVVFKKAEDQDEDTDWDTDDSDEDEGDDDEGGDFEMGDAPALVATPRRERQEPEVDEDGFTKVTKKKR